MLGGVCSGKSAAARALNRVTGYQVLAKDNYIYISDMARRCGVSLTYDEIRKKLIAENSANSIILDEMIKDGSLRDIERAGYCIVVLVLHCTKRIRHVRLSRRIEHQKALISELSELSGISFENFSRPERRRFWQNFAFRENIPISNRDQFDQTLFELYHTGADYMKEDEPNPTDCAEADFICDFEEEFDVQHITVNEIEKRKIPSGRYFKNINRVDFKFCIWDIGDTLYAYTLDPVYDFLGRSMFDRHGKYQSFRSHLKDYMTGSSDFLLFAKSVLSEFGLSTTSGNVSQLREAFHRGVGPEFANSLNAMTAMHDRGIINLVLSNALELLQDVGTFRYIVRPEHRFYSFRTGFLKPDERAYIDVLETVGADASEVLFIDDKKHNIDSAANLGICGIHFNDDFEEILELKVGRYFR